MPDPEITVSVAPEKIRPKTIVYIDGFNFYYGLVHKRPDLKWIDYQRLSELLRPDDDILAVKFFTSLVDKKERSSSRRDRQNAHWAALKTRPKIQIIEGKFSNRTRDCGVSSCIHSRKSYTGLEEKQTDVNIALQIVLDVQEIKPDFVIILSGDIDLIPPVEVALRQCKKVRPRFFIPCLEADLKYRRADELKKFEPKPIPEKFLRQSQFPDIIQISPTASIHRPHLWAKQDASS
jgi:uncharacterized LabA/DUF88 family protein